MPIDSSLISVTVRSDTEGHWVDWSNAGETGILGPYQTSEMADDVRAAKANEFAANSGHIDDATA